MDELIVTRQMEYDCIVSLCSQIPKDINASNTLVVMVSPDYSATVAMHVAHYLSYNGEMCDIITVDVPYPDEEVTPFIIEASKKFSNITHEYVLLVEAGIIRGGNYTWLTELLAQLTKSRIRTSTLYENIHSKFKSDYVARYYDAGVEDLTFYYEQYNKHWS
jgi:hypothetical protein